MIELMHMRTYPERYESLLTLLVAVAALSGCSEAPVEQVRQRHDDTMGHAIPITYEVGDDWVTVGRGRYSPRGLTEQDVILQVSVDSAHFRGEDLSSRLKELKRGPRNGREDERQTLIAEILTLNNRDALEFARQQERGGKPGHYNVSHRFEFVRDRWYIEVRLKARLEYYDRYVNQLKHTSASVKLAADG